MVAVLPQTSVTLRVMQASTSFNNRSSWVEPSSVIGMVVLVCFRRLGLGALFDGEDLP